MRLSDYLDKGASLGPDRPCLTTDGESMSYAEVVALSHSVASALAAGGLTAGGRVAILSANDPVAFACVFGISRAGAVWCPINPRNEAAENAELLELFDAQVLIFQQSFAALVEAIRPALPGLHTYVCLDGAVDGAIDFEAFLASGGAARPDAPLDDLAMLVGTGGTTGRPKGVMLTDGNLETMTALTLMGYPFDGRPVYLALAPLTHAAGVLCFPILALGGQIVIMRAPDVGEFLDLIGRHGVTHTFLPPTLIYMVLASPQLASANLSSLQCFWYGAAPISPARLAEALDAIGPMAQLFGQTEAPMMISTMPPQAHRRPDGSIATERLASAGRPSPLVQVAILDDSDRPVPAGTHGEICVRSSLVMRGYYKNPEATAEALRGGWLHTGDIGYLDEDNFLFIVDRAKDMIISGGFNVYSTEVEQALIAHPAVQDCGVIGLPDDKWGERVVAVVQLQPGASVPSADLIGFAKSAIGSVKAPKQVEVWPDLPRSKVGKVLKSEIRDTLLNAEAISRE
ncbi:long-chain fatty acid--CoA ligase [Calidifontibacter sp. DB0510]|uniref:Long-chain fatty acid--CoA ligase n=1 Tax=Metallococcus carri TaxID=1656884 RepID=A0A967AZJ8_9MICO|nr:long-chain fatty acid--CoA ligase [Metallococcus carri]NHN56009.1 long-chain fatty acid--CoA ligase [Metallococcus carri]NOP37534.1 long-chain fatty acid--CoA ligase [Calidifontibacter sp. DB2511S]